MVNTQKIAAELGMRICSEAKPPQICFSEFRAMEKAAYSAVTEASASGQFYIDVGGVQLTKNRTHPMDWRYSTTPPSE